jgi:hypothetical protein
MAPISGPESVGLAGGPNGIGELGVEPLPSFDELGDVAEASISSSPTSRPRCRRSPPAGPGSATTCGRPGGLQILLEDPSGDVVELFQPVGS